MYSEKIFEQDPAKFYAAAGNVLWANFSILWRLYVLSGVQAAVLLILIVNYGSIRSSKFIGRHKLIRKALATFVLPRVSEWHFLMTGFKYAKATKIHADILTKLNVLYRGDVEEPLFLSPTGELAGVLISNPYRFLREEYLEAKKQQPPPVKADFWRAIPSQTFLIMAGEIETINIRKTDPDLSSEIGEILKEKVTLTSTVEVSPAAVDGKESQAQGGFSY